MSTGLVTSHDAAHEGIPFGVLARPRDVPGCLLLLPRWCGLAQEKSLLGGSKCKVQHGSGHCQSIEEKGGRSPSLVEGETFLLYGWLVNCLW
jgi:hypothetical protein